MISVHVVNVGLFNVDPAGNVVNKQNSTLKQNLETAVEHRVIPSPDVPSSANRPGIKEFLIAEAAAGYVLHHMDQTTIVTYRYVNGVLG